MLYFYYVDREYIAFLKQYDPNVPNMDYSTHDKFFCGIVLCVNGIKYYAPISHFSQKQQTNMLILNKGNPIASLRFSFMIPVKDEFVRKVDFNKIGKEDSKYADLLRAEYRFCVSHINDIKRKALSVYKIGCNKNHRLNSFCCQFAELEKRMEDYWNNGIDKIEINC